MSKNKTGMQSKLDTLKIWLAITMKYRRHYEKKSLDQTLWLTSK
jgi:hypothetical protein